MKRDRAKFLKKLNKNLKSRNAAAIERMHLRIYKQYWHGNLLEATANNMDPSNPNVESFSKKSADEYWQSLIKETRHWGRTHGKKSNRAKTWKVTSVQLQKKGTIDEHIHVYVTFIPVTALRKKAKAGSKTSGTVRGTRKWYLNCTNSWKRMIKKWIGQGAKKVTTNIVMEHGKYPENRQEPSQLPDGSTGDLPYPAGDARGTQGQPELGLGTSARDTRMNRRESARGNNLETSLIQTLSNLGSFSDEGIEYLVEQVSNFIGCKYRSEVIKTRDKNKLRRQHRIYITPVLSPVTPQTGQEDKKDIELVRDIFSSDFDEQLGDFIEAQGMAKRGNKKFDQMMAASPDFYDDLDGFTEAQIDKMITASEKHFAKRRAEANIKTKVKKKGFKKKLLEERQRKKDKLEAMEAAKPIITKIASFKGKKTSKKAKSKAAPLSSITASQRSRELRKSGITQGKEGLLITEMINGVLERAVRQKMVSPGLINRTGRFARSAEVLQTLVGPRGGLYVDYTYDKEPYGVFEPGHGKRPWSNQYRDPRRIIGQSIREIIQKRMVKVGLGGAGAVITRKFR